MAQITLNSSGVASNGALALQSNGTTTAVTIDTAQNVGIGTTSTSNGRVNIQAGTSSTGNSLFLSNVDGTYNPFIQFQHNGVNGTKISNSSSFGGTAGNLTISPAANAIFETGSTERARIDSSGNLAIGSTSAGYDGTNTGIWCRGGLKVFQASRDSNPAGNFARIGTDGAVVTFDKGTNATVGSISITTTSTAYVTSSDYRLKNSIAPMTGALGKVALLKPVTYKWNVDGSDGQGFIAHELQEVCPDAVSGEKDGEQMQGVDYGKLTPILTAALQEAIAKIETLEARIAVLEAK